MGLKHLESNVEQGGLVDDSLKQKVKVWRVGLLSVLIPLVVCSLRLLLDGKWLGDIYLPSSTWNDELLYYKLTEACVNYTIPQGYFGFNESHAAMGGFAAWSPVLQIFWNAWGVVFGWNLLSPILCNLFLMVMGMYFYGRFMHVTGWRWVMALTLFAAFTPVTRFTLSGMPEAQIYALLLFAIFITWDTAVRFAPDHRDYRIRLWMLGAVTVLLTLMRPYYVLLFGCLIYLGVKKNNRSATAWICGGLIALTCGTYVLIGKLFSAPYLTDLFYTDWITVYFREGVLAGLKYDIWKLLTSLKSIGMMMLQMSPDGKLLAGTLYLMFLLCLAFWIYMVASPKKWEIPMVIRVQMLVLMAAFFGADLMMYRLQEGGRHTIPFILATLMCLPVMGKCPCAERSIMGRCLEEGKLGTVMKGMRAKRVWAPSLIATIILVVAFGLLGNLPYEFDIPYATPERVAEVDSLRTQLSETMQLDLENPGYANTIIWPIWDQVDGKTVVFDWGLLYAVPTGFGINACDGGYMEAQVENLKCGYVATTKGSEVEARLAASEKTADGKTIVVLRQ